MTITRGYTDDVSLLHKKVVELGLPPGMSEGSDALATWSTTSIEQSAVKDSPERRKLRNEDSSYDSDFEPCDMASPQDAHEDISRTVSETLGAEFEEYVTLQAPKDVKHGKHLLQPESRKPLRPMELKSCSDGLKINLAATESDNESVTTIASIMASPDYPQRVEFGVKLGYSESLVQLALTKLGANPDKNKLLDELIRLDAGAPRAESEGEDADPETVKEELDAPALRPIIIDGSNVAMSHGSQTTFSCRGIKLCVDWFRARGHKEITVFVPQFRKEASKVDSAITDREILIELEREGFLCFTPSKSISGKRIVAYDDRYVLKEAANVNGVVVSNDNYRDLMNEKEAYRKVVEESLLMYSWVKGRFEPPEDPFGRNGPSLDVFLKRSTLKTIIKEAKTCPYGRKCTYGNKCKFTHPERGTAPVKSVTQRLQEHAQRHYQEKEKAISRDPSPGACLRSKTLSLPVTGDSYPIKRPVVRTHSTVPDNDYFSTILREEGPLTTCSLSLKPSTTNVLSPASQKGLDGLAAAVKSPIGLPAYGAQMNLGATPTWNCYMEAKQAAMQLGKISLTGQLSEQDAMSSDNRHKKLQRQLSINPVHDARLSNKFLVEDSSFYLHQNSSHSLNQKCLPHHFNQDEQFTNRSHLRTKPMVPPFFNYPNTDMIQSNYHTPVTRHSSSHDAIPVSSYTLYPPYVHNHVTRNLSAPDAVWGSHHPPPKYHARLNSTSDSHLNIHACDSFSDPFDEPSQNIYQTPMPVISTNPGPVGSRPISPQQPVSGIHHPHLLRMPQMKQMNMPQQQLSSKTYEDERFKIFYHLSQLFPEAQVRSALIRNPQETDPTKICASILNIPADHINAPSLTGPMGQFPFSSGNDKSRAAFSHPVEAARMEAYSVLSKLFLEDQVRKVLAAYPEETDPTKLCMLLVALNSNPT